MSGEAPKKARKRQSTVELFKVLIGRFDGVEARLARIEAGSTLTQTELQRHSRSIDELNRRCTERLGLTCPLDDEDDDEESGKHEDEELAQGKG